jgi:hypothetical protein
MKSQTPERFQPPKFVAQSGRKISQEFVNEVVSDIKTQGQARQPQVITFVRQLVFPVILYKMLM